MKITPEKIKAARLKAGQTQLEAARVLNPFCNTARTWNRYESGISKMSKANYFYYLSCVGIDEDEHDAAET